MDFLAEAGQIVGKLRVDGRSLEDEKRLLHTLKGNTALFSLTSLSRLCRELEDSQAATGEPLTASERVRLAAAWDHLVTRLRKLLGDERSSLVEIDDRELASTREAVSETSGRGVGLSAVHEALAEVSGTVEVDTTPGQGTTFTFSVPYADTDLALRASLRPAGAAA